MQTDNRTLLEVRGLKAHFHVNDGVLKAVDGIDLTIKAGHTVGIVGESGSGKSVTAQALLRIVPPPGKVEGEIRLLRTKGKQAGASVDMLRLPHAGTEIREIRGGEIAMIFQEPMKAFSPVHTIGNQIMEAILLHREVGRKEAHAEAVDMLARVGVSNPAQRMDEYPHQLSGGMRQRAMIAMALSCRPSILIADEPTTALDVTVQSQVLQLIDDMKDQLGMSVVFVTHDLGVIAETSDEVAVMYLGKIVEYSDVDSLFFDARHPYTQALLASVPSAVQRENNARLKSIDGVVPVPIGLPPGCGFYSRCKFAVNGVCNSGEIPLTQVSEGHYVRCLFPHGKKD